MTDWYCSSAAYAGYTAFQTSHLYSIGDVVVPTAPAFGAKHVFKVTTAGTSTTEPSWTSTNNATSTSGTAVFTNRTGQTDWSAAAGDVITLKSGSHATNGDRIYVSSDHTETQTTTTNNYVVNTSNVWIATQFLCVNRAGSVPPTAADLTTGATLIMNNGSNNLTIGNDSPHYWYGFTFEQTGTGGIFLGDFLATIYLRNCQLWLNTNNASSQIGSNINGGAVNVVLDNTTVRFGASTQIIQCAGIFDNAFAWYWFNTPNAIVGPTFPATLFNVNGSGISQFMTCRGVDFSNIAGTLVSASGTQSLGKYLFESCKIAQGVTRYSNSGVAQTRDIVALSNVYDGTNFLSEIYQPAGSVKTEYSTILSGGAVDDISTFSHKMTSDATDVDKMAAPLYGFWIDVENTSISVSKTATVEIISSTTLNNDDCYLWLEYEGTSGSSIATLVTSQPAALVAATPIPTSTASWMNQPSTPVTQKLQVTFTAAHAGRVHCRVMLGKAATTVWYNPQVTIT